MDPWGQPVSYQQDTWQDYNHAPVQFEDFFESTKMEDDPLAAWDLGPDEVGPGEAVEIVPSEIPPAPVTESRQNDVEAEKEQSTTQPPTISPQALQAPFPPPPTDRTSQPAAAEVIHIDDSPAPSPKLSIAEKASSPVSDSIRVRRGISRLHHRSYMDASPPPSSFRSPPYSSSSLTKAPMPTARSTVTTLPDDIANVLTAAELARNRPIDLFRNLRTRTVKGEPLPPVFEPNPSQLLKILNALSRHASKEYLRLMADDERYIAVFRAWLLQMSKNPQTWAKCIAPLFSVLSRTDIAVDVLADLEIARLARALKNTVVGHNFSVRGEVEDAYREFQDWCKNTLFKRNRRSYVSSDESDKDKPTAKKPKIDPKAAGPSRPKPDAKPATKPVEAKPKTDVKPRFGLTAQSKTDMSYFGAPAPSSTISSSGRPTKPLASIPRKTSPPRQPPPTASTLLAQTLAKLKPVAAAASVVEPVPAPASAPPKTTKKPNKKGFVVKFRDDTGTGDLEEVKLFTQAEHEHELAPWQEDLQGVSMHQMDVSEGSALKHHEEMEEEVEWYEPYDYAGIPELIQPTPEALAQEQREASIINVNYEVLPSADESTVRHVAATAQTHRWHPANPPQASSVTALLGALNPGLFGQPGLPAPAPVPTYGYEQHHQPQPWQQPLPPPQQQQQQQQWPPQPVYGLDPTPTYGTGNVWGEANGQYQYPNPAQHGGQGWNHNERGGGYQGKRGGKKGGKNNRHNDTNGYHDGGRPQDHGWGARR